MSKFVKVIIKYDGFKTTAVFGVQPNGKAAVPFSNPDENGYIIEFKSIIQVLLSGSFLNEKEYY